MHLACVIASSLLAYTAHVEAKSKTDNAILLSKVRSLTLRHGQYTAHRRVNAIPQLSCVGGNAQGLYHVDVMRCLNSGSEYDAEDIQWTCKADLPPEFKLGSTDVICEGYASAEDPYVLKGSCGVEYRLVLTEFGEEKYRDHIRRSNWKFWEDGKGEIRDSIATAVFWLFFAAVVLVIIYSAFYGSRDSRGNGGNGRRRGYGGGGHDDGHDDPPPPYTPRTSKSYTSPRASSSSSFQAANRGWRPGFWTGAATGAAAAYTARAWGNQPREYARPGPSNWFGGGGGSGGSTRETDGFGSRSPPTPSSSRQESTGFGGTRRR